VVRFAIDANGFSTASEDRYLKEMFIPGILRAGGLPNALALIAPRPLLLHNTGDVFETAWASEAYGTLVADQGRSKLEIQSALQSDAAIQAFLTAKP